jgi:hypothetical protein
MGAQSHAGSSQESPAGRAWMFPEGSILIEQPSFRTSSMMYSRAAAQEGEKVGRLYPALGSDSFHSAMVSMSFMSLFSEISSSAWEKSIQST